MTEQLPKRPRTHVLETLSIQHVESTLPAEWICDTPSEDRTVKVWNLATGRELATVALEATPLAMAIAPDGVTVVIGDGAGTVSCLRYVEGDGVTRTQGNG